MYLKPKWDKHKRDKKNTAIVQDLVSKSKHESKVRDIGLKGNISSIDMSPDSTKRTGLFHIQVISKHTKIDILLDSGSLVNIISE